MARSRHKHVRRVRSPRRRRRLAHAGLAGLAVLAVAPPAAMVIWADDAPLDAKPIAKIGTARSSTWPMRTGTPPSEDGAQQAGALTPTSSPTPSAGSPGRGSGEGALRDRHVAPRTSGAARTGTKTGDGGAAQGPTRATSTVGRSTASTAGSARPRRVGTAPGKAQAAARRTDAPAPAASGPTSTAPTVAATSSQPTPVPAPSTMWNDGPADPVPTPEPTPELAPSPSPSVTYLDPSPDATSASSDACAYLPPGLADRYVWDGTRCVPLR